MASSQTFKAGVVPAGRSSSSDQVQTFWDHCDEVARLGFHHIEINDTRARIAEYYAERVQEFKEAMVKRSLSLVGMALFSRAARSAEFAGVLDQHAAHGRFLAAVGGSYVTHMIAPGEILNEPGDEAAYAQIDLKVWAANANQIGRRLLNDSGVKLAYHPEQGEVRTGLFKKFMDATDERHVYFLPDTGHLAAGGADSVEICKAFRRRIACVHLKQFSPAQTEGKGRKAGNVPFGEGVVDLPGVVNELRRGNFAGYVMSESGGTNQAVRDYMTGPLGLSI